MIIKAIVHQADEGGFWAEVPALPGCLGKGSVPHIHIFDGENRQGMGLDTFDMNYHHSIFFSY
jgi:hypothetical protein